MTEDKVIGNNESNAPKISLENDGEEIVEILGEPEELEVEKAETEEIEVVIDLEQKLEDAEAKAAEYLDGWQRARAEYANARKRLERDRAEAFLNASVEYAKKLLPIMDDFDRALDNAPESIEEDSWFEGILLVQRKLKGILDDLGVEKIEATGQVFDPNFHEALALREADGVDSGLVIEELQSGYRLGERVIRPALVNVSA